MVVKKDEFKLGDLSVYCEIDSLLPEKPEFEFLRNKKFRIKTIKMRGVISQGIVFPLSILVNKYILDNVQIGQDVTEALGITKYEPPISPQLMGMAKGNFPIFIPKTDEERLQSRIKLLDEMKEKECYITQKEDGTSFTAYHIVVNNMEIPEQHQYVGVCSRNMELKNESFPGSDLNIYWKIAKQYNVEESLKEFYRKTGRNIAVQGEICGSGIQKNRLGLSTNTHQLHLFNIFDIDNHKYVDYDEFINICNILELPHVEVIYTGVFNFDLEQLLKLSEGKYKGTHNEREGIVIRPIKEEFSDTLQGRLSFKVINNLFLLQKGE